MRRWPLLFGAAQIAAVALPPMALAQVGYPRTTPPPAAVAAPASAPAEGLRVYLGCGVGACEYNFVRDEIKFVRWVREPQVAELHVMTTSQPTGGGGSDITLLFLGRERLAGIVDTLHVFTNGTNTQDEARREFVRVLKLGLARYVLRTPLGRYVKLSYAPPDSSAARGGKVNDPWRRWVFRISAGGDLSAEQSQKYTNVNGSMSIKRTTESMYVRFGLSGSYDASVFTYDERIASYAHNLSANVLSVRALGEHWSAGLTGELSSSTYKNQLSALRAGPALEFDVWPYSESSQKKLTFLYTLAMDRYHYEELTIFDKIYETRYDETLDVRFGVERPFGTLSGSIRGSHYMPDPSKWRAEVSAGMDVRLFKGFSVTASTSHALIRNQLYLAKAGATEEEVLLRKRQLATSYRSYFELGFNYTFGSIFDDIVFPRFEAGRY